MKIPDPKDLPAIEKLLKESDLPIDDLLDMDLSLFRVVGTEDAVDAVGGLECRGEVALLRSVAAVADLQGRGMAKTIVQELERLAASRGIDGLYLLMESASAYFGSLGYVVQDRDEVPRSIRESRQFSSLCSESAIVMYKRLDG